MAASSLVACELLCYSTNKYGKIDNKKLISVIHDFYLPDHISVAKDILVSDAEKTNSTEKWPRPNRRRDSDLSARVKKDINEILSIWTYFDEHNLVNTLPVYVARDLNRVPTAKLEDGDIRVVLNKLEQLETGYVELRKSVNNIGIVLSRSVSHKTVSNSQQSSIPPKHSSIMRQSASAVIGIPTTQVRDSEQLTTSDTDCEWEISPEEKRRLKRTRRGSGPDERSPSTSITASPKLIAASPQGTMEFSGHEEYGFHPAYQKRHEIKPTTKKYEETSG